MDFGKRGADVGESAAGTMIIESSSAKFVADVIDASRALPVIVDFWAPWCGPCKQLTPVLEKVVSAQGGKVRLVKINIDENQAIAAQLRIQSVPTVYAFMDGRPVDGFAGAKTETEVKAFVDLLVGDVQEADINSVLQTGAELLEQGDLQGAAEVFAAVLQEDGENAEALAGLAQCYVQSGDIERARQTLALVPPDKRSLPSVQSIAAVLELAEKAGSSGDLADLERRVRADPKDYQARLDLAIALAAMGDKSNALEHLLELVRRDRKWNEEAGRKQLLQFFDAWGPKEPLVAEGRRRLSSILFS